MISQSIINLIKNSAEAIAVKHKNNQTGIIQIEMKDENKFIHIIITDNGCGLPIDDINKLTEPYFTTREKGTGLGLAVVKKITEDHNGKLFMENIINEQNEVLGARTLFTISKQLSLNNNAVVTK